MDILAKSAPELTLEQHIEDCLIIYRHLQECFPSITNICGDHRFDFWGTLKLAVIFHDLGKAHPEFQKVLRNLPNNWLGQRHELFSLPFIESLPIEKEMTNILQQIVAGHHKPYDVLYGEYIKQYQTSKSLDLNFTTDDILDFQYEFNKIDQLPLIDFLKNQYEICIASAKPKRVENIVLSYLHRVKMGKMKSNDLAYFQLLLLFGALKHCDHLGSARLQTIEKLEPNDFDFLNDKRHMLKATGGDFFGHQLKCAQARGNVLLTSPTGSGKTESAMLWLNSRLNYLGQGRAFYVLPFTASINAMYERLADNNGGLGNNKVGMLHGKLNDYLYAYLDEYQYDLTGKKEEINSIKDKFKALSTPLKVITPFQLLKHLFGLKGFEKGLFECAGAYFIFDEIHAYSPTVFAQIKVLLDYITNYLHAKVMIMTATMPSYLRRQIESSIVPFSSIQADPNLYNNFDRHKVLLKRGLLSQDLEVIISDIKDGKKVLVVCNTIKESQKVYRILKEHSKYSVLLHGAFTGEDRNDHEIRLKKGEENKNDRIQLLVGTQAIEVSLDIDYDVIYTEPAPFDALIQRFGRVNRKRSKGISPVFVFMENNASDEFIYKRDVIGRTLMTLEKISTFDNGIIKEVKLQHYIDHVYPKWDPDDYDTFQEAYNLLSNSLTHLYPMLRSKQTEEEFYRQFDGIKVLPIGLKGRYTNYLSNFDFVGAERLKVQIRKNKFAQLINENDNNLFQEQFIFDATQGKTITIQYWVLTKKYDKEIGLLYDEQETWSDDSMP